MNEVENIVFKEAYQELMKEYLKETEYYKKLVVSILLKCDKSSISIEQELIKVAEASALNVSYKNNNVSIELAQV